MSAYDVAIVGAGMAGASAAFFLADDLRVLLLERESRPGYHATGRSAALYTQAYGNAPIRALTVASKPFYDRPPAGFAAQPVLSPRGALVVATADQTAKLEAETEEVRKLAPQVRLVDANEARRISPALRPDYVAAAAYEPDAADMDVDAILQGFLRGARAKGVEVRTDAEVLDLAEQGAGWRIETRAGVFEAGVVVNAAGAWAMSLARLAGARRIEITPKRRTAFLFKPPPDLDIAQSPLTVDVDEQFYFKPDAGLILGSPADETPVEPQDAQPEEIDVAVGADRIQMAAALPIQRIEHRWAGLRSFALDKTPVVGFDDAAPGFFWLAGQGGYGIQTAPAMGALAAGLIAGRPLPPALSDVGFNSAWTAPQRFKS